MKQSTLLKITEPTTLALSQLHGEPTVYACKFASPSRLWRFLVPGQHQCLNQPLKNGFQLTQGRAMYWAYHTEGSLVSQCTVEATDNWYRTLSAIEYMLRRMCIRYRYDVDCIELVYGTPLLYPVSSGSFRAAIYLKCLLQPPTGHLFRPADLDHNPWAK